MVDGTTLNKYRPSVALQVHMLENLIQRFQEGTKRFKIYIFLNFRPAQINYVLFTVGVTLHESSGTLKQVGRGSDNG